MMDVDLPWTNRLDLETSTTDQDQAEITPDEEVFSDNNTG
tara:strand:- start:2398 stop:2517 length:120 start_codon:yes stop_codon:yes gene_type:complete